jgi:hypothetical protein
MLWRNFGIIDAAGDTDWIVSIDSTINRAHQQCAPRKTSMIAFDH